MKRFAANYLLDESGVFLKNGIIEADDSGNVIRIQDTKGDLRESGQLAFQNGILISGFELVKIAESGVETDSLRLKFFSDTSCMNLPDLVAAGINFQEQFPESAIPQFFREIEEIFIRSGNYKKIIVPGIFLLTGIDLVNMKFTPKSRVRKLL